MSKNNVLRRYNFSDIELKQIASSQLLLISRDINDFSTIGFDENAQIEYKTKLDFFYNYPSDELLESNQMVQTKEKKNARKDLEQKIRMIQCFAQLAFPKEPSYQRAFGNTDITRQSDAELVNTGLAIKYAIIEYRQELQSFGITENKVNEFNLNLDRFTNTSKSQYEAIRKRDISTFERIQAGNAVYDLLVKYARLGQLIYMDKSDPRHNDYVIYAAAHNSSKRASKRKNKSDNIPPLPTD